MQRDEAPSGHSDFEALLATIDEGWWTNRILAYALDLNFLVQNCYPGQRYGLPRAKWLSEGSMWKNRVFVTEPIVSFRDRCLVVISEFSPCQTWVFAVGTDLAPAIIFNNEVLRNTRPLAVSTRVATGNAWDSELYISTVQEMVYVAPGKYLLVDYDLRFGISREIEITAKDDNVSLVGTKVSVLNRR